MMQAQPSPSRQNGTQQIHPRFSHSHSHPDPSPRNNSIDQADSDDGQSDDDNDGDELHDSVRNGKRKRPISVSCELCKQRKVKCDRGQPACGWCTRNAATCEYKERKKPGLRAGYGRELEQRLDKLERILQTHSDILQCQTSPMSRHSVHLPNPLPPQSTRPNHDSTPGVQGPPRDAAPLLFSRGTDPMHTPHTEAALFLPRPPASLKYPALQPAGGVHDTGLSAATGGPSGVHGPAPGQEYSQTCSSASQSLRSPTVSAPRSLRPTTDGDLPPYDQLYTLVDLYFKHINTWCPILHRQRILDTFFGPSMVVGEDKILLHAIVATALRYSTNEGLSEDARHRYHEVSKQRVLLHGMENLSVKSLQALVVLALDLCGSSNGPPGWNIMALITRAVVQLGLAVETNSLSVSPAHPSIYTLRARILPEASDFVEEEARRRLFWMIYLLDRYATVSTAFEFALDDREIDRMLPCSDDLWIRNQKVETRWFRADDGGPEGAAGSRNSAEQKVNRPENLGTFSYYIEVLGVLSKIHKFLKQPVDIGASPEVERWQRRYRELDAMLHDWTLRLPTEFRDMSKLFQQASAKSPMPGWIMLHATYHTAVIRLHSSAAYPTTRSPYFTASYSAAQRCNTAVDRIAALGDFVDKLGFLSKLGPPFAFTLWVAARALLVHGSTVERKLSPHISFFVDTLRKMGRYWPVAGGYSDLLSRVLDEHRESERQGGIETPNSVRIFADMRRTAFDLDFLISRQPRHTPAGAAMNGAPRNGGAGSAAVWQERHQSSQPPTSRTPAPNENELAYLDVFGFFNVPLLPVGPGANMDSSYNNCLGSGGVSGPGMGGAMDAVTGGNMHMGVQGQFNIIDYMVDQNRDWLFEQEQKYMG
ncbi:fungal-specific transcription factor domain-containing protein [Podospora conica]|nr:fungal-specific transcription factor domain-containing protein [Schizothecium conicum]